MRQCGCFFFILFCCHDDARSSPSSPGLRGLDDPGGHRRVDEEAPAEVGREDGGELIGVLLDHGGLHRDDLEETATATAA